MAKVTTFLVNPAKSLTGLKEFFTPDALVYFNAFNEALVAGAVDLPPREVYITPLPLAMRSINFIYTPQKNELTLESVFSKCVSAGIDPAPIPYHLGLLIDYYNEVARELVVFIESLYFPETFSFKHKFGKRSLQTCFKKDKGRVVIDVSEYITNGILNLSRRIAPQAVKMVAFKKEEGLVEDVESLKDKMIG